MRQLLLLLAFSTSQISLAQDSVEKLIDLSIEELMQIQIEDVYGASKRIEKVNRAPASITIVDRATIQRHGYATLAELLAGVRSFYIRNDRVYDYFGVRGLNRSSDYNSRILQLINGHRINDNIFQQAMIGTEGVLDIDLIERVEIIRGPSSSLYGSGAFFGVINIITRDVSKFGKGEVSGQIGSFSEKTGRLTLGHKFENGLTALVSGTYSDSKGQSSIYYPEYDTPTQNRGRYENNDNDIHHSFFTQVGWKLLTIEGAHVSRRKSMPTGQYQTVFNDPRNQAFDIRDYLKVQLEGKAGKDWNLKSVFSVDTYVYHSDEIDAYSGVDPTKTMTDRYDNLWYTAEIQGERRLGEKGALVMGGEYIINQRMEQSDQYTNPQQYLFISQEKSENYNFFAQGDYRFLDWFSLSAGLRFDHYQTFGDALSPRLVSIFSPTEKDTLKLILGSAFRAPNGYEFYYNEGSFHKMNPLLKPENIFSQELLWERYFNDHWRSTFSIFHYRISNMINAVIDPSDGLEYFGNIDEADGRGTELEVENIRSSGMRTLLSYTFSEVRDQNSGERLSLSPKHLVKTRVSRPFWSGKLEPGFELQYVSSQNNPKNSSVEVGDYFLTNVSLLSRNIVKGLTLSGSVHNLFDRKYAHSGSTEHVQSLIPQPGITFRLKAILDF